MMNNQHVPARLLAHKRFIKCELPQRDGERKETGRLVVELERVKDVESWAKGVASIP